MWITISVILLGIIVAGCLILPPSSGKTTPFLDAAGNVITGSLSEKVWVALNGVSLGMFIMARDESKPVLLFLGGGPGIPEYLLEHTYPTGLEAEFVVCYLEYRGTSLSYSPDIPIDTLTTEFYIADVVEVTKYLLDRFGRKKIYLLGHSFGTYIGLKTAAQYPELYYAYIAMSQISSAQGSEKIAYRYMLEQYQTAGNTKMVKRLMAYPILASEAALDRYLTSALRDTAMHDLGVGTMRSMTSVLTGLFFPSLRCAVYTPAERLNIWKGKAFAQTTAVFTESRQFDSLTAVPLLDIPIYFLAGVYDYTVCSSLQREYYHTVQAPLKGFYTFNHSAHSPLFEESERAVSILVQDVLAGTTTMSDSHRPKE